MVGKDIFCQLTIVQLTIYNQEIIDGSFIIS